MSGIKKGSKIVAIPFKGEVTLVDVTKDKFSGSLNGFKFKEDQHEATKFLFTKRSKD
ncbi:MAG: hypothetical protein ACYCQJ_01950 [Nitrososphaerales archaeon]